MIQNQTGGFGGIGQPGFGGIGQPGFGGIGQPKSAGAAAKQQEENERRRREVEERRRRARLIRDQASIGGEIVEQRGGKLFGSGGVFLGTIETVPGGVTVLNYGKSDLHQARVKKQEYQEKKAQKQAETNAIQGLENLYDSFALFGQTPSEDQTNKLRSYVQENIASGNLSASDFDFTGGPGAKIDYKIRDLLRYGPRK